MHCVVIRFCKVSNWAVGHLVIPGHSQLYRCHVTHVIVSILLHTNLYRFNILLFVMWLYCGTSKNCKSSYRAFAAAGPNAWNQLPLNIQNISSPVTFKHRLITRLFCLSFQPNDPKSLNNSSTVYITYYIRHIEWKYQSSHFIKILITYE